MMHVERLTKIQPVHLAIRHLPGTICQETAQLLAALVSLSAGFKAAPNTALSALGNRSILSDPRDANRCRTLSINERVKFQGDVPPVCTVHPSMNRPMTILRISHESPYMDKTLYEFAKCRSGKPNRRRMPC